MTLYCTSYVSIYSSFFRRENVEEGGEEETEDEEEGAEVEEESFVARSAPCLGCPKNIDVNSPEVIEMANFALSSLENAANSDQILSVVRIVKATSQVRTFLVLWAIIVIYLNLIHFPTGCQW